jgi:hypothetical protein
MKNKITLYVDQYGMRFYAKTVKELRKQIGGGGSRISRMYIDQDGKIYHKGYVIGRHWLTAYQPIMNEVTS